jgi:hypothetical protein
MSFFRKVSAFGFFLLISLSFGLPSAHAQDGVTYLGDFCWEMRGADDSPTDKPMILQLGIMSYGAGHFPVHGKIISREGDYIQPVHGNAELYNDKVEISLSGSELDPIIVPLTKHIILNLTDFEGTFYELILSLTDAIGGFILIKEPIRILKVYF